MTRNRRTVFVRWSSSAMGQRCRRRKRGVRAHPQGGAQRCFLNKEKPRPVSTFNEKYTGENGEKTANLSKTNVDIGKRKRFLHTWTFDHPPKTSKNPAFSKFKLPLQFLIPRSSIGLGLKGSPSGAAIKWKTTSLEDRPTHPPGF